MEILMDIVKNLLVIIVLSTFLELLLPDGQLKPFVRFSIGLFVIVAVLSPALSYLYDDRNFQVEFWNYRVDDRVEKDILNRGKSLQKDLGKKGSTLVKEKVQGQISAVAMLVPGVDNVHTEVLVGPDGTVSEVKLLVRAQEAAVKNVDQVDVFSGKGKPQGEADQQVIRNKILQVLANLYGIEDKCINIDFEGRKSNAR